MAGTAHAATTRRPTRNVVAGLLRCLLLTSLPVVGSPADAAEPAHRAQIDWRAWTPASVASAKAANKPILLELGVENSLPCAALDQHTFGDPALAALIAKAVVPIRVDAEAEPDVAERYRHLDWPAIVVLAPSGEELMSHSGPADPIRLHAALAQVFSEREPSAAPASQGRPAAGVLPLVRDRVAIELESSWLGQPTPTSALVDYALLRAHWRGSAERWRRRVLAFAEDFRQRLDPEWGGVYRLKPSSNTPRAFEKRLSDQAAALRAFVGAYRVTGNDQWLKHSGEVRTFIEQDAMATSDGLYAASVGERASHAPLALTPAEYFAADNKTRREHGQPRVDAASYTDTVAELISAYIDLFEATGDRDALGQATNAARVLVRQRLQANGTVLHHMRPATDTRRLRPLASRPPVLLRSQGLLGIAMLDVYRATGAPEWLGLAETIARGLGAFGELQGGGLVGRLVASDRPLGQLRQAPAIAANAIAARFLWSLGRYTHRSGFWRRAERVVRSVGGGDTIRDAGELVAELALTLERMTAGYVDFSIVGTPGDAAAEALFNAAREVYEPRKLLHYEQLGRYPVRDVATLFICNERSCSRPIDKPSDVREAARPYVGRRQVSDSELR